MNFVDVGVLLIVALYMLRGWSRGFLAVFMDLAGLIIAFLAALRWYPDAGQLIADLTTLPSGLARALGFLFIALATGLVYAAVAGSLYHAIPRFIRRSFINRALGLVPAAINGLLVSAFFLTILVALPVATPLREQLGESMLGEPLVNVATAVEAQLRPVFGEAISQTLNFLTIRPESHQQVDLPFKVSNPEPNPAAEVAMLQLVNQARRENGLPPLQMDEKLRQVARAHSRDMLQRGYFAHNTPEGVTPFQRMEQAGIRFMVAGENLALARTVQVAHTGLMNSPGHRANILNGSFRKVGIGVMDGGIYGLMFSQEFTN